MCLGECVNGECVCDPGVIQSVELLFQPVPGNSTVICDYNISLTVGATITLLVVCLGMFLMQLVVLTKIRQVKRGMLILIGYILLIPPLVIRLAKPTEPLWGVSYPFTICLALHMMVYGFQVSVFMYKYVVYLERTVLVRSDSAKNSIRFSYATGILSLVFVSLGSLLFITTLFVESLPVSKALTRAGAALYAIACLVLAMAQVYLFTKYIGDVNELLRSSERTITNEANSKFLQKCRRQLPRFRGLRAVSLGSSALLITTYTMAVVLDGWLKNFVLVVYFSILLYQLCNLCVIRTFSKRYNSIWKGASNSLHIMLEPWRSKRDLSVSSNENALQKSSESSARFASSKPTL